jgi:hypothetical protein
MTKPVIVTRAGKGAPLTSTEGDSNFSNLKDATIGVLANGTTVTTDLNGSFEIEAGTGITVAGNNTSKKITITNSKLLSGETAPTLGADLDVATFKIVTTSSNRNIELDPHGTGVVAVTGPMTISGNLTVSGTTTTVNSTVVDIADKNITVAKGSADKAAANGGGLTVDLGTDGTASIEYASGSDRFVVNKKIAGSFLSNAASDFSGASINLGSASNITITGGTSGYVLRTDGAGALTWVAQTSGPANTDALSEGSTNLYFTNARARSAISATGSLSYNSSTGVISFTETTEIPSQTGNSGKYLTTNGTAVSWGTVTSGIATVSADTSPSLGGNLNVNGNNIVSSSNGNIRLAPNGTGKIVVGSGSLGASITSNGAYNLILNTNEGTDSGQIIINQGLNGNIAMTPNGTGKVRFYGVYSFPTADGSADQFLKTDGSGNLSFATPTGSFVATATADLNMATFKIKTTSSQNLAFETSSSSYGMDFKSNTNKFGYLDSNVTLTTNGVSSMTVKSATGGTIVVADNISAGGHITLTPAGSGQINLAGPLKTSTTSGTPSTYNTSYFEGTLDTPASWLKIDVGGSNYYLPMFQ